MRDWISTKLKNKGLNINVKEISLTGSGRIGQSLAPKKLGQTFTEQVSDLDVFVISGLMFEEAYRTKKELSIVRHGEIILYKLDFILSFHPVMTPQFAL